MNCAWKELLGILSPWIRAEVDRTGRETLQDLRLRINAPPELIGSDGYRFLGETVREGDIQFCVNAASKYSPWSAATAAKGYLTAPGGHRIGLCGQTAITSSNKLHLQELTSLCIRVARDFPGIAKHAAKLPGSILILGAPGWGKTTLLRDVCRRISERETVCVVDERGEVFPEGIARGKRMDVLTGCPKGMGIDRCLRTMGPQWIAVDEITAAEDCAAIGHAAGCGVKLLATAHASSRSAFLCRPIYGRLSELGVSSRMILLNQRKQWHLERMNG